MQKITKALLIPFNQKGEILIQDRENYKPPRWGYFGGSVEQGESIKEGLIREAKEELNCDITEYELIELGQFEDERSNRRINRWVFLIEVNERTWHYKVNEGKGAKWVKPEEMIELMKEFSGEAAVRIAETTLEYIAIKTSD